MGGAFQTSRDIFVHPIWHDIPKFRIFFYIVGNAVFSSDGVKIGGVTLQRGQFLRSYRNLQNDLEYIENRAVKKYSLSLIKRKVDQLVKEERLKIEDTELGTLFTVVNYALYQCLDNYKTKSENAERTAREQHENSDGTQGEQRENNNKNVNKDNNDKKVKKDKTSSPKQVYDEDSIPYKLALRFYQNILVNDPDYKKPNLQNWANDVRLMMERDNRTEEQIIYLMDWCQNHSFWKSVVLSTSKLREKFGQLVIKVKEEISRQNKPIEKEIPRAYQSLQEWADEA